jgi:hypothetical protein
MYKILLGKKIMLMRENKIKMIKKEYLIRKKRKNVLKKLKIFLVVTHLDGNLII